MANTPPRAEMKALTSFRGLAALLVVAFHIADRVEKAFPIKHATLLLNRGYLWVDFFFVLSGFIMAYVYGAEFGEGVDRRRYLSFLWRRLARVYPLHLVLMLGVGGMYGVARLAANVVSLGVDPHDTLASFVTNLLLIHSWGLHDFLTWNHPSWSISCEWAAYLLFPALLLVSRGSRRWLVALVTLVCAAIPAALAEVRGTLDLTFDYGLLRCIPEFMIGLVLHRVFLLGPSTTTHRVFASDAMAFSLIAAVMLTLHLGGQPGLLVILFAALVLALALNRGRAERALSVRPLYLLGLVSYSIYMCHSPILRVMFKLFEKFADPAQPRAAALFSLLYVAVVLGAATALYHLVEKPGRALMQRWYPPR